MSKKETITFKPIYINENDFRSILKDDPDYFNYLVDEIEGVAYDHIGARLETMSSKGYADIKNLSKSFDDLQESLKRLRTSSLV